MNTLGTFQKFLKSEGSEAENQAKRREQLERSEHKLEEPTAREQQQAQRHQEAQQKRAEEKTMTVGKGIGRTFKKEVRTKRQDNRKREESRIDVRPR